MVSSGFEGLKGALPGCVRPVVGTTSIDLEGYYRDAIERARKGPPAAAGDEEKKEEKKVEVRRCFFLGEGGWVRRWPLVVGSACSTETMGTIAVWP
jgi:hypothetical protein